jgi:hypothetical protein
MYFLGGISIILDIQVVLAFASDIQIEEDGIQPLSGNLLIKSTDNRSLTCP